MSGRKRVLSINKAPMDEKTTPSNAPLKKPSKIKPGLDYGVELLANPKFTPPSSPQVSEFDAKSMCGKTSLYLDISEGSEKASLDNKINKIISRRSRSRSREDNRSHISLGNGLPGMGSARSRSRSRQKSRSIGRNEIKLDLESSRPLPGFEDRPREASRAREVSRERSERPRERSERSRERSERRERERSERSERPRERSERRERERSEKSERPRERSERSKRPRERSERRERERSERPRERSERRERERSERPRERSHHERERSHHERERSEHHSWNPSRDPMDLNINDIIAEDSEASEHGGKRRDHRDDERSHHDRSERRDDDRSEKDDNPLLDDDFKDEFADMDGQEEEPEIKLRNLSPKEIMKRKRKALLHIKILEYQGYAPMNEVGITSPLEEILEVEEEQMERRSLTNGIEFGKKILVGSSYVIETLNRKYDPFDVKLDGWSDQMFEDKDEYNEVMEELYYKYSDQVQMSPEIKLLMMMGGSAMMFHFSKSLMSSGNVEVPNFENIMNRNPDLKRAYEQEAMSYMMENQSARSRGQSTQAPNIMSNILGNLTGGDPGMANAVNNFMSQGGRTKNIKVSSAPKSKVVQEVDIIPPADPDNILESPPASPETQKRMTRSQREAMAF